MFLQPETYNGIVVLCGNGAIVGMTFLRKLDKYLIIGDIVTLIDTSLINQAIQSANQAVQAATPAQPPDEPLKRQENSEPLPTSRQKRDTG
jgi:hypothetical protein